MTVNLIIDATSSSVVMPTNVSCFDAHLQELVAQELQLPFGEIQRVWTAVDLIDTRSIYVPGESYVSSLTIINRELDMVEAALRQQGKALKDMSVLLLLDEDATGACSVAAGCAVQVFARTGVAPIVMGVQVVGRSDWHITDTIPGPQEQPTID
jgi:hypothetical protein